jgi:hypothetical protein
MPAGRAAEYAASTTTSRSSLAAPSASAPGGPCPGKRTVFAEIHRVLRPGALPFADAANGTPVPPGALRDIDLRAA